MTLSRFLGWLSAATLILVLAGCRARSTPVPVLPPDMQTPAPSAQSELTQAATPAPLPSSAAAVAPSAQPRLARSSTPIPTPGTGAAEPFFLGVPAGDAYAPSSIAVDAPRRRAYVYHADSAEARPVISVIDLEKGQVNRVIRLASTKPSGSGRLLLAPDGNRLYVIDHNAATLTPVDPETGALGDAIPEIRDGELSPDGATFYAVGPWGLRAFNTASLLAGDSTPLWGVSAEQFDRLALNDSRVLASVRSPERLLLFDAVTGRELASTTLSEYLEGLAPGPDGGWAARATGDEPHVLRFDADLKPLGSAPAPYGTELFYDAARERYLVAGQMPGQEGATSIRALRADDLAEVAAAPWPSYNAPDLFVPYGDSLLGLNRYGPARLIEFGPALDERSRVITGVTLSDMALDEATDTLYVADDQGRVRVLSLSEGRERATWAGAAPIALDAANRRLYVNSPEGVQALDTVSGKPLASFPQRGVPAPDPRGDRVYIADRGVTIYDRSGREVGALPDSFPQENGFSPNPYAFAASVNPVNSAVAAVFNNGVPGSNNASYLRIYPQASETPQEVPGYASFVTDMVFDPITGDLYASYSPAKNLEKIQRLGSDGHELARLDGRSGRLALDPQGKVLYAVQDGVIAAVDPGSLALQDVWRGPAHVDQIALDTRQQQLYVLNRARSRLDVVPLDSLSRFTMRPEPVGSLPVDVPVDHLAVAGDGNDGVWLIADAGGAPYRSRDGERWERLPVGSFPLWGRSTVAGDGALFYAGQGDGGADGVWRSTDFGTSWGLLSAGLTDLRTLQPVRAESADRAYFAGRTGGLFAWAPGPGSQGGRWELRLAPRSEQEGMGPLSLAPDRTLFLGGFDRLSRSTDGGHTWAELPPPAGSGEILGFSPHYTETHTLFGLYGETARELVRSTDAGETWAPFAPGAGLEPSDYAITLAAGRDAIYLHGQGYGDTPAILLRSTDNGDNWQAADASEIDKTITLAVAPDDTLWFGLRGGVVSLAPGAIPWSAAGRGAAAVQPATPTPWPGAATPKTPPVPAGRQPHPTMTPWVERATRAPSPTPVRTPCGSAAPGQDAELAGKFPELGCPLGAEQVMAMARQRFQHGRMLWLSSDPRPGSEAGLVLVLLDNGSLQWFGDRWREGQPTSDPALVAPSGLQQPVRGFGLVWREQLGGPNAAIGWAVEPEQGITGTARAWDGGLVVRAGGELFVLLNSGAWRQP